MPRCCVVIFLLFSYGRVEAQINIPGRWIKIINKGFIQYGTGKHSEKNILFAKACDSLGDYYFQQKKYAKALTTYRRVADLAGHHADGDFDEDDKAFEKYHVVALEKVGKMLLKGQGTAKDTVTAVYYLDRHPNNFSLAKRKEFSKLVFGHTTEYFIVKPLPPKNDTIAFAEINPFFIYESSTALKVAGALADIQLQQQWDTNTVCRIMFCFGVHRFFSEYDNAIAYRFLKKIESSKAFKQIKFFSTDIDYEVQSAFEQNQIRWPELVFIVSKQSDLKKEE